MKLSVQELLIVLAIVLIIFGPTQIPKLVKSIKKSSKAIQEGLKDEEEEEDLPKAKKASKTSSKKVVEDDSSEGDE